MLGFFLFGVSTILGWFLVGKPFFELIAIKIKFGNQAVIDFIPIAGLLYRF